MLAHLEASHVCDKPRTGHRKTNKCVWNSWKWFTLESAESRVLPPQDTFWTFLASCKITPIVTRNCPYCHMRKWQGKAVKNKTNICIKFLWKRYVECWCAHSGELKSFTASGYGLTLSLMMTADYNTTLIFLSWIMFFPSKGPIIIYD